MGWGLLYLVFGNGTGVDFGYERLELDRRRKTSDSSLRRCDLLGDHITLLCVTLIFVELRNITFSLPSDLIRRAKVHAAQHDTTVNAWVRELLEDALGQRERLKSAAGRLLELADRGPYFTKDPSAIRREDLYERR